MGKRFEELVREACQAELRFREHAQETKLSVGAIVDGCLQRCGSTLERLNALRRRIEDATQHLPGSRGFIRQTQRWFSEGRISSGIPANSSRMALPSRDLAEFEVMQLGNSLYELWAIAVQNTALRNPEAFGNIVDRDAWQERLEELKAVRDGLFDRINQTFEPGDTIVGPPRSDGSVYVYFKLAPEVLVHPLHNAAERLVNHLLSTDPETWRTIQPQVETKVKRSKVADTVAG